MANVRKKKNPGDTLLLTLDDNPIVLDFINNQSVNVAAIRFAIEFLVEHYGNIDIAKYIPPAHDIYNPSLYLSIVPRSEKTGTPKLEDVRTEKPNKKEITKVKMTETEKEIVVIPDIPSVSSGQSIATQVVTEAVTTNNVPSDEQPSTKRNDDSIQSSQQVNKNEGVSSERSFKIQEDRLDKMIENESETETEELDPDLQWLRG